MTGTGEGPAARPADAAPVADSCGCLREAFAALLAAHLQIVADVASLRYEVARLAGAAPGDAAAWATDGGHGMPAAEALEGQGFDPRAFRGDLERALRARAERDAREQEPPPS